jgi:hypothetical protein
MSRDGDDAWDSCPGEQSGRVNRADWDEDDWEGFLLRQDALNAKYQELYETLRDHPRRDELIAREMGWRLPERRCASCNGACGRSPGEDPDAEEPSESFEDVEEIPAYLLAQDYALTVERQLTARLRDGLGADEDAARATRNAVDISAHIADGHGLGYEREFLCGNIACCKRSLGSLAECMDDLLALRQRGVVLPSEADELLRRGRTVGESLHQRIEELRRRVWWR